MKFRYASRAVRNLISGTVLTLLVSACGNSGQDTGKEQISVSILPQQYFLEQITGDLFDINVILPPGASPATYEPTPAQLADLSATSLYFRMGYTGFELAWMDKIASANDAMEVINLAEGIDLAVEKPKHNRDHGDNHDHQHHGGVDPHTWLSPANVKIMSKTIHQALTKKYPSHREFFDRNLESWLSKLDSLDRYIFAALKDLGSRSFFIYHPALTYYSRDYRLDQHPLELDGKEPSAAHMKALIDTGIEHRIGVIFLQMQFDQRNAETLARETGAEIVQINPLDPEWLDQMYYITNQIKKHLQ